MDPRGLPCAVQSPLIEKTRAVTESASFLSEAKEKPNPQFFFSDDAMRAPSHVPLFSFILSKEKDRINLLWVSPK